MDWENITIGFLFQKGGGGSNQRNPMIYLTHKWVYMTNQLSVIVGVVVRVVVGVVVRSSPEWSSESSPEWSSESVWNSASGYGSSTTSTTLGCSITHQR